jgi:hypothetical protein
MGEYHFLPNFYSEDFGSGSKIFASGSNQTEKMSNAVPTTWDRHT